MYLKSNSSIVFAGDSVTDANRDRNLAPGDFNSYGDGYVRIISAALTAFYPAACIEVINAGVNGDDIHMLANRWPSDVLALKPDYIAIMIGINDVWRWFDATFARHQEKVTLADYEKRYDHLLSSGQAAGAHMLVLSPFMFEPNVSDPMRAKLADYQAVAKKIALNHHAPFIDIQATIDAYLINQSTYTVSKDRVHPKFTGAMLVARSILDHLEFDWQHLD